MRRIHHSFYPTCEGLFIDKKRKDMLSEGKAHFFVVEHMH
jgi:hypothetical protein